MLETSDRLPDFIVIGAMKSGTSSLYHHLCEHPDIIRCRPKEPEYFSVRCFQTGGLDWYRSLFAETGADQLCGEASTGYTRALEFPGVPKRIAQTIPQAKLIYIMRHPIDRTFSHYRHVMTEWRNTENKAPIPLAEAIRDLPQLIDTSLYMDQIERYLQHFDREQMFFVTLDDYMTRPGDTLTRLSRFLDVPAYPFNSKVHINRREQRIGKKRVRRAMASLSNSAFGFLIKTTVNPVKRKRLRQTLRRSPHLHRLLASKQRDIPDRVDPEQRVQLLRKFANSTRELELFLGTTLSEWYK